MYDTSIAPWAPGTQVHFSYDANGSQTNVAGNPQAAFTLDANLQAAYTAGVIAWNTHAGPNGSNVTYQPGAAAGAFNHIITVAWPSANITWTDSAGHTHTQTVTASNPSAVAATFYIPNHNSSNQAMSTAGAAVTLINTSGTYTVDNVSHPMWDPAGANFLTAIERVGAHETGHGFGLGHPSGCGNVMSNRTASSQNPTGGTNDNAGCTTSTITPCDDQAIRNSPNYPQPECTITAECPMGFVCTGSGTCEASGCQFNSDCPSGFYCSSETGACEEGTPCQANDVPSQCYDWDPVNCICNDPWDTGGGPAIDPGSPIVLSLGPSSAYRLTSVRNGVWFDLDADGLPDRTAWTRAADWIAFLALDRNGNGIIDDGSELFGNNTRLVSGQLATDGFNALAEFDLLENGGNNDGQIGPADAIWAQLLFWVDWNHSGSSEPEELTRLNDSGLSSIQLSVIAEWRKDRYGNVFRLKAPVKFGQQTRFAYDIFFVFHRGISPQ